MTMLLDQPYYCTPSRTIITSFTPRKPQLVSSSSFASTNRNDSSSSSSSTTTSTTTTAGRPISSFHNNNINNNNNNINNGMSSSSRFDDGDWVLCLTSDQDGGLDHHHQQQQLGMPQTLACALSNGEVQVYDTQRLHMVRSFPFPNNTNQLSSNQPMNNRTNRLITDIKYGPQHSLVSSNQDGSLVIYDLRQSTVANQANLPSRHPALCIDFGFDGYLTAVGSSKGRIHFLDLRNPSQLLGSYVDSHRDDVTQVCFFKNNTTTNKAGWLLSSSEDGLLGLFDTTQPTEELALKSIINVNAPIRKAGFCGNHYNNNTNNSDCLVYCLTGNETLSLWNADTASLIHDFGWNTRQQLSTILASSSLAGSLNHASMATNYSSSFSNNIDYLVDARWENNQLLLLAGDSTGDTSLFRVSNTTTATATVDNVVDGNNGATTTNGLVPWNLEHVRSLVSGHRGVVRAWCPLNPQASSLITAGEDARLCEWHTTATTTSSQSSWIGNYGKNLSTSQQQSFVQSPSTPGNQKRAANKIGGPIRRLRHKKSTSPY